jgi:hypothetical protein
MEVRKTCVSIRISGSPPHAVAAQAEFEKAKA